LKEEKRANHLDTLDEFMVWRTNFYLTTDEKVERNLEKLTNLLNQSKNEMNEQFEKPDNIVVKYVMEDVKRVENKYKEIFKKRKLDIDNIKNMVNNFEDERLFTSQNYIIKLKKDLNEIGYILDYEVEELFKEKIEELNKLNESKKLNLNNFFNDLEKSEKLLFEEADVNFGLFVKRWKNIKLNFFLKETQDKLSSPEFSDPPERYSLLELLKADQIKIYQERVALLEQVTKLSHEELNANNLENYLKKLEKLYNDAQNIYDIHTHKLLENSDNIYNRSMQEIDIFKGKVKSVDYVFDSENGLEELINLEIIPIVNKEKEERKEYLSKIIAYLEDYDEYTNNCAVAIMNIFKEIGVKIDSHKKNLSDNEKKYLLDLAKEADEDENNLFEMEEKLKKILDELKTAIHKDVCDKNLKAVFDLMDQMEKQYRGFFEIMEKLLSSHDQRLTEVYHAHEKQILSVFWIFTDDKLEEINKRRNEESEFRSKIKEFEISVEEAKDPKNKKKPAPKALKKGEVAPLLVAPRPIEKYTSSLGFNYWLEKNMSEICQHILRNIIPPKSYDEMNKTDGIKKEEKVEEKKEEKKDPKGNDKKQAPGADKNKKPEPVIELPKIPEELKINPYDPPEKKVFNSPLSLKNGKMLYVVNY